MAYRYYDKDVEEGLTDFNDDVYHILETREAEGETLAIVFVESTEELLVVRELGHHKLDSIDFVEDSRAGSVSEALQGLNDLEIHVRKFGIIV